MIYLALPYSHDDDAVCVSRYYKAQNACAKIQLAGFNVYCPVVHWHTIAVKHSLPRNWSFWESSNKEMLHLAQELWVLPLDGWKDSEGVQYELALAREEGKVVYFLSQNYV